MKGFDIIVDNVMLCHCQFYTMHFVEIYIWSNLSAAFDLQCSDLIKGTH